MRLATGRAYAMRMTLQEIYETATTRAQSQAALNKLYNWLIRSRLEPMKAFARTLKNHLKEILNYWDLRLTNATLEGLNSIIQTAKCRARGFRNDEYVKTIINLVAGKINLEAVCPSVAAAATHSI